MLDIYIARHGQNEDNALGILNGHRDLPLTALGREQAQKLADAIVVRALQFDTIYTSPLLRAMETAAAVANRLGKEVEIEPDLIERDFGMMTGRTVAEIERVCAPDVIRTDGVTYFLSPAGAETFPDLLVRAGRLLGSLRERHAGGSILLVCHGDIGKMLYASYYGLNWRVLLPKFHFKNSDLLLLSPTSPADEAHVFTYMEP